MSTNLNDANLKVAIIAYAKARPPIWDTELKYSQSERDEQWRAFADGFNLPVEELWRRWESLRLKYCKHLRALLSKGETTEWVHFAKLDEFLRRPIECLWKKVRSQVSKEGVREGTRMNQVEDIEFIDLSSDDGHDQQQSNNETTGRNPKSEENAQGYAVGSSSDVHNQLWKSLPFAGSSPTPEKPSASKSKPNVSRHRIGHKKRRTPQESHPGIPDAKKRLIKNCGELIPLRKSDSNDGNSSKSLPNGSSTGAPVHKMLTPPTSSLKQSGHRSTLKKFKSQCEKRERRGFLRKVPPASTVTRPSGSSSDGKQSDEMPKVPVGVEIMKVAVGKSPVSTPSVDVRPSSETKASTDNQCHEFRISKIVNERRSKDQPEGLIVLDNSDVEDVLGKPEPRIDQGDIWRKWEAELKALPKTEGSSESEDEQDDPESTRKARENFLLSFLPDMNQMNMEERRFFKSKLMYLVCNIDQFS